MTRYDIEERRKSLLASFDDEDRDRLSRDVREILSTEAGRRVFAAIAGSGRVFGRIFGSCGGDAIFLAYESGRREKAVEIYSKANEIAPDLVIRAIVEQNEISADRKHKMDAIGNELERTDK